MINTLSRRIAGIDIRFVECALSAAPVVYSLHKSSTREFIQRKGVALGATVDVLAKLRFDLPKMYRFHQKQSLDVQVDFIKFTRRP